MNARGHQDHVSVGQKDDDDEDEVASVSSVEEIAAQKERRSMIYGSFLMVLSGLMFSIVASLVHWGHDLGYQSMEILMFRSIVQFLFAFLFGLAYIEKDTSFTNNNVSINNATNCHKLNKYKCKCKCHSFLIESFQMSKKLWLIVIIRGLFGAMGAICYTHSISVLPIGDAVAVFSLYPVLTAFTAKLFLNEKLTLNHIIALLISCFGVIMISQPSFIFSHNKLSTEYIIGYTLAALGAIFGGIVFVLIRMAKEANVILLVASHGLFCFFEALIGLFAFQSVNIDGLFVNAKYLSWICVITVGICGYFGQWTINKSAQLIPAGLSSLLRSSDILWSYIWEIWLFNTIPNTFTIIGACCVFLAICIVSFEKFRQFQKQHSSNTQLNANIDIIQRNNDNENNIEMQSTNKNNNGDKNKENVGVMHAIKSKINVTKNKNKYEQLKTTDSMMSLSVSSIDREDIDVDIANESKAVPLAGNLSNEM